MHVREYDVEDERPIPLGRAQVDEAGAEGRPAAYKEDAKPEPACQPAVAMAEAPVVAAGRPPEPASTPAVTVLHEHPTQSLVSRQRPALTAEEPAAADAHPLGAFRRFRLEAEVVASAHGGLWTGLGRLLLVYALVMALVLALILAFAVLVAHGGRAAT